jgi:hypothetical protein
MKAGYLVLRMKITSSLNVTLAAVAMSFAALTAQAAVSPVYTNTLTTTRAPVTFELTFKSLKPATTIQAGTYFSQPSGASNGTAAFYDDYTVTNSPGVITRYQVDGLVVEKTPFGNAEFLAALATNGILSDSTPQGWTIGVQVSAMMGPSFLFSTFYATKGTNIINISQYISAQFPVLLGNTSLATQQSSNNVTIGTTFTGAYIYEGPMVLTLHVPTSPKSTVQYTLSGLGTGSSSEIGYTYLNTQNHTTNYGYSLIVAGAFSLPNGVGSYSDTNNNPVTIEGKFGFGASKSVAVPNPTPSPTPTPIP